MAYRNGGGRTHESHGETRDDSASGYPTSGDPTGAKNTPYSLGNKAAAEAISTVSDPEAKSLPALSKPQLLKAGVDRQFAVSGKWALATDGLQWVLQRHRHGARWGAVSFVRSTKDILARCMRDKGATPTEIESLLGGLPASFDEWISGADVGHSDLTRQHGPGAGSDTQNGCCPPTTPHNDDDEFDWPPDDGGGT